jgi:hypothetical protein
MDTTLSENGRVVEGERHVMYESAFNTAGERHGMCESALTRQGNGMVFVNRLAVLPCPTSQLALTCSNHRNLSCSALRCLGLNSPAPHFEWAVTCTAC